MPKASEVVYVQTEQVIHVRVVVSENPHVFGDQYWSTDGRLLAESNWSGAVAGEGEPAVERAA